MIGRERDKLKRVLGGIEDLNRLPAALFIIDIKNEHIAVSEAQKLNIPTIAMVDTNSDPGLVDFPIPSNDDATKSIALICGVIMQAIEEGMQERKHLKEEDGGEASEAAAVSEGDSVVADVAVDAVE